MQESPYLNDASRANEEDALDKLPLLRDLDQGGVSLILSISKYRMFDAGEDVTTQGEFDPWVYILLEGDLGIDVDGERVAKISGRGAVFGEMVLIDQAERSATVVALSPVRSLAIDAVLLDELDREKEGVFLANFYRVICGILANRLREADEELSLLKKEFKTTGY